MAITDGLKRLFGAKGARKRPGKARAQVHKSASTKTVLAPSQRAALIEWAVKMRAAKAAMARGLIDQSLKEFRATPPKLGDMDALARLLRIHRAETDLRRLMNHREWRYLVLTGLRELLLTGTATQKTAAPASKKSRNVVVKR